MSIPTNSDEITASWLTTALRGAGVIDLARVVSFEVSPVGQIGMTGQIMRLRFGFDENEAGAPESVVAKFSSADPQARTIVHCRQGVSFQLPLTLPSIREAELQ